MFIIAITVPQIIFIRTVFRGQIESWMINYPWIVYTLYTLYPGNFERFEFIIEWNRWNLMVRELGGNVQSIRHKSRFIVNNNKTAPLLRIPKFVLVSGRVKQSLLIPRGSISESFNRKTYSIVIQLYFYLGKQGSYPETRTGTGF